MRKLILPDHRSFLTRSYGTVGGLPNGGDETWTSGLPERASGPRVFETPLDESGFTKLERANRLAIAKRYWQEQMDPQPLVELQRLFAAGAIAIVDPAAGRRARRFRYSNWKGR